MSPPQGAPRLVCPVSDPHVTSPFGQRKSPITGETEGHPGIDYRAPEGTEIRAAADGEVARSYTSDDAALHAAGYRSYGESIVIAHGDGWTTRYAHLSARLKLRGDQVKAGDVIARSGNTGDSTGPHLHFELRWAGVPYDPEPYFTA